jgi:hypothetical protein
MASGTNFFRHWTTPALALPLAQLEYRGLPGWVTERLRNNLADTAQHWPLVQQAYREIAQSSMPKVWSTWF